MLVNRVLLAQGFVCAGSRKRLATKGILAQWKQLAQAQEPALEALAAEAAARLAQAPGTGIVWIARDMLREGRAEPWQLPVVLGVDAGMAVGEVVGLFRQLVEYGIGYINQRCPKIQRLLADYLRSQESGGSEE